MLSNFTPKSSPLFMKKALLADIIGCFFFLLFFYTGVVKLVEIHQFKEQLVSSPLLGSLAGFVTWALPIGELLLAIALFIPRFRLKALYATLILMTLFTAYVIVILFMDNQLSCSCGGIIEELSPKEHVLFNSACVILAVVAIAAVRRGRAGMHVKWWTGTSVIVVFLFIGWTLFSAFSAPVKAKTGMEGRLLPSFDLLLPDSLTHLNTATIPTGKTFVVIGFEPWCAHCQAETEDIIKNIQQLKDVSIYYVTPYPFWQMKVFYQHFKLAQYPNITIGKETRDSFLRYFKAPAFPFTAVFDSKKRLKQAFATQIDAKTLIRALKE
jgi:thiol-disulfide isomerase/thioredoxin